MSYLCKEFYYNDQVLFLIEQNMFGQIVRISNFWNVILRNLQTFVSVVWLSGIFSWWSSQFRKASYFILTKISFFLISSLLGFPIIAVKETAHSFLFLLSHLNLAFSESPHGFCVSKREKNEREKEKGRRFSPSLMVKDIFQTRCLKCYLTQTLHSLDI